MKFILFVKASKKSEAGVMPSEKLMLAMARFNEELEKAGALLDAAGLRPSSSGARIRFSGGTSTVVDGPFAEAKELVSGYWIIQARSMGEAIEWARRAPFHLDDQNGAEAEVEVRQYFELTDYPAGEAVEREARLGKRLGLT